MEKKKYEMPRCAIVVDDEPFMNAVSVDPSGWGDQSGAESRSFRNKQWDDDDNMGW